VNFAKQQNTSTLTGMDGGLIIEFVILNFLIFCFLFANSMIALKSVIKTKLCTLAEARDICFHYLKNLIIRGGAWRS
jgi:hypothetical protein